MIDVPNSVHDRVLSFVRRSVADKVFAVFNFLAAEQTVTFRQTLYHGTYVDYFGGSQVTLDRGEMMKLEPWGYRVLVGGS